MKIKTIELEQQILSVLTSSGYSEDEAQMITDVLMFGELSGQPSHGIARLVKGDLNIIENCGEGKIEINEKSQVSAVIKANKHPGVLVGQVTMRKSLELAEKEGIGMVTSSGTFSSSGCLAYYLEQIALRDRHVAVGSFCKSIQLRGTALWHQPDWFCFSRGRETFNFRYGYLKYNFRRCTKRGYGGKETA